MTADAQIMVDGNLTLEVVPKLFEEGLVRLDEGALRVDFSQVEAVDSSAISMPLGWERAAQQKQNELSVTGLPDDLLSLARLYGVEELLPNTLPIFPGPEYFERYSHE